jgi:hypothetical protein
MFGDWSWLGDRTEDQYQRYNQWLQENRDARLAIVECGAGTGVPTVRMTSERIGASYNATLIRINTREPFVPPKHISIPLEALETLQKMVAGSNIVGADSNIVGAGSNIAGAGSNIVGADSNIVGAGSNIVGADSNIVGAGSEPAPTEPTPTKLIK